MLSQINSLVCNLTLPTNRIDVAMGTWTDTSRGLSILDALRDKVDEGCEVRILVQKGEHIVDEFDDDLNYRCTSFPPIDTPLADHTSVDPPSVHSKYVLWSGMANQQPSAMVFTGSENFTQDALRHNDEAWLKVRWAGAQHPDNAAVYMSYEADFNNM